jgi:hypothetical protein
VKTEPELGGDYRAVTLRVPWQLSQRTFPDVRAPSTAANGKGSARSRSGRPPSLAAKSIC